MKIVSDHGFPKGSLPTDDAFDRFKNERDYIAKTSQMETTVAAMDWAAAEIDRLREQSWKYLQECGAQARRADVLAAALARSMTAIDDWLQVYAAELCDPERVKEAERRIGECGTLWYIATVQEQNRAALSSPLPPSNSGGK